MSYSAYSLTFAMANHPLVNGWDTDVIAEDHHMFCKCYFASIWTSVTSSMGSSSTVAQPALRPKVKLNPIYLPVVSYMVEDSAGWKASCIARFQQARRHSQGVSEISYTLLQYIHLVFAVGMKGMPLSTHCQILGIAWKMSTVHLTNTVHAFAIMLTSHFTMVNVLGMLSNGELWTFLSVTLPATLAAGDIAYWTVAAMLGVFSPLSMMMTYTSYQVLTAQLEGKLLPERSKPPVCPTVVDERCFLNRLRGMALYALIWFDMTILGESTIVLYGLIPELLACCSLSRCGNKFEYIVAAKPT
jgi:hypothetical protein